MGLKTAGEKLMWNGFFENAVYIGLHTANPTAANELDGNAYARVQVPANGWTINENTGTASNTAVVQFPVPTGDWGDPTHVAVWSAAQDGDLLWTAALGADVDAPAIGEDVEFAVGQLTFSVTTD